MTGICLATEGLDAVEGVHVVAVAGIRLELGAVAVLGGVNGD
jgi:hypothetical protein